MFSKSLQSLPLQTRGLLLETRTITLSTGGKPSAYTKPQRPFSLLFPLSILSAYSPHQSLSLGSSSLTLLFSTSENPKKYFGMKFTCQVLARR